LRASSRAIRREARGTIVRHALVYGGGRVFPAACAVGVIAVASRALSPDDFGRQALATSQALLWAAVASVWLAQSVLRFHSRFGRRLASDYASFVARARWWCAAGAALSASAAALVAGAAPSVAAASAALAALEAALAVACAERQAALQPARVVALDAVKAGVGLGAVALVAAASRSPTPAQMVWGLACGAGVAAVAAGDVLGGRRAGRRPSRGAAAVRGAMLRFGAPIGAYALLASLMNTGDRFLIGRWNGLAQAGAYAGVYDVVSRSFGMLLFPVVLAAHPIATRAWNRGDRSAAQRAVRVAIALQLAIGVPLVAALALAHRLVLRYTVGMAADRSLELVATIGAAALLWQVAQLVHKPSELSGRVGVLVAGVGVAAAINVATNAVLLPGASPAVAGYTSALTSASYIAFVLALQRKGRSR
jgi:O-antigen/teichoic acid export membrane protein